MSDMRDVILQQANQITQSLATNQAVKVVGNFDSIILAGMGGSGHPGDLLNALGICKLPLYVHRNYGLPLDYLSHMGFSNPLVITSSYSGNTEESLTAYQVAKAKNHGQLGSAAGGQLKKWCEADNVPFCFINFPDMQPRHTLFAAFTGIYTALRNSHLVDNIDQQLNQAANLIAQITPTLEKSSQQLADQINQKIPVYISSDTIGFAAKNFKIQTNENAKYPGFWNTFPELNHNELVGFSKLEESNSPNKFIAILLRDEQDHPRVKARMDVTAKLYQKWGVEVATIDVQGENLVTKLFYTVTCGLWTTYHLALANNVDPVPVDGVEDFKTELKELAGDAT